MARDLFKRYIWLIDLLSRYGRLTRDEINSHWLRSSLSDGRPIPERSFFHFRRAIEEYFNIDIRCNTYHEYYIEENKEPGSRAYTNLLLDSFTISDALRSVPDVTDKVMLEEVPSARGFLPSVLEAISGRRVVTFTYAGFARSRAEKGIKYAPYFVRLYKQRWYMVGQNLAKRELRTYALDRITELEITGDQFEMPADADPHAFFSNVLGVTVSQAQVKTVVLKTTPSQAKYFRALPLHPSQQETVNDNYSLFTYRLKLNYELVHEILGLGSQVQVLQPKELILMVKDELDKMNSFYGQDNRGTSDLR